MGRYTPQKKVTNTRKEGRKEDGGDKCPEAEQTGKKKCPEEGHCIEIWE